MDAFPANFNLANPLLNVDSYKASHFKQYPPGTEYVSSYIESRGGRWGRTLFYGLQIFLKEYLSKPITRADIEEAAFFWAAHGEPFNREGWEYILEKYNGYLPIRVQAAPEGLVIPVGNVLVQIINTDPKCFWLPSYLETALLRAVWYPTAIATNSYMCKQIIKDFLDDTADDPDAEVLFKLHNFGGRGVSSFESAGIGASAHLLNFMGTDTVTGALFAMKYYGAECPVGYSIPAAEHSTTTSWGGEPGEILSFKNMIDQFGKGLYACVSDSYDIYEAVNKWYSLRDEIVNAGGTLVVRPDSGNPVAVVAGVINALMARFGYTINSKGYKVLPSYLRVIQGDGIDEKSIRDILTELKSQKISASNIAFGMGGCLLQNLNRDTLSFACKASEIVVDGVKRDVYKEPITDFGKRSKRGRLALLSKNGSFETIREDAIADTENILLDVFENGKLLKEYTFDEVRASVR